MQAVTSQKREAQTKLVKPRTKSEHREMKKKIVVGPNWTMQQNGVFAEPLCFVVSPTGFEPVLPP
jgi:hypothetical protein